MVKSLSQWKLTVISVHDQPFMILNLPYQMFKICGSANKLSWLAIAINKYLKQLDKGNRKIKQEI